MRWLIAKVLRLLLVVALVFAGLVAFLGVTTPDPRAASRGWERLADMPNPRGEVAAALGARADRDCPAVGEPCAPRQTLFVIGGLARLGRTVRAVGLYDPRLDAWTDGPELPEARHHPAAAAIDGTVYVSGGARTATNWRPEPNLWALAPDADRWERLPAMPEGRMGHQMAAVRGKLYVIGGRGRTSNVLVFDRRARAWSAGAQMPRKRDHLAIAVVGDLIVAIGGRDTELVARVDVYDTSEDSWSDGVPLPVPMSGMAAGTLADGIHVVGGENPKTLRGGVLERHHLQAPGSRTWGPAPLPLLATHGSASAVIGGRLFVAGGARRQGALSPLGWTGLLQAYGT